MGPVWQGGQAGEAALLASCYAQSLALAERMGLRSVAFPAIGTGVYGYPRELAAQLAVRTVLAHGAQTLETVIFCCFSADDLALYQAELAQRKPA